jgi:predicted short-subunit dehydrogenase-like oxidoreductase (DUF2520 family)
MSEGIFIIGGGAVGTALGRGLVSAGREVAGVFCRTEERAARAATSIGTTPHSGELPHAIRDAQVIVVAVIDPAIGEVVEQALAADLVAENQVWLHCSGALTGRVLDPLSGRCRGRGSLHPALAFPAGRQTEIPPGTWFAVAGDAAAIAVAEGLVGALSGRAVRVPDGSRATYHAALVMASNYLVALLAEARLTLSSAGVDPDEIEPLLLALASSAINGAKDAGVEASLTGPIRRGDAEAVERHLSALADRPEAARLYRELGRTTLDLARRLDGFPQDALTALQATLAESED